MVTTTTTMPLSEAYFTATAPGPGEHLAALFTAALDRGTSPDDDLIFPYAPQPPEHQWRDVSPTTRDWLAANYGYIL